MARPLRLLVHGGIYHVTSRGNGRAAVFHDDRDNVAFLGVLARTVSRFGWQCLSFCLMANHFHLLVQTPEPNLPRGMQQLKSRYATWHNDRYDTTGHLWEPRYGAVLIQRDSHLLEVFRYIALNPVRARLAATPTDWPWSAHAALAGLAPAPHFLAVAEALRWFDGDPTGSGAASGYRTFVGAPTAERYDGRGVVFGDDHFARSVLPATRPASEIPIGDWGDGRPPLTDLLGTAPGPPEIAIAYRRHGYTLAEIALVLDCHVTTVSRRLASYERTMLDCKI